MTTGTEQRLTAALTARADQVRAEDLRAAALPPTRGPRRRRTWAVVTTVAVACAAAIAVTFVVLHHDRTAAPALPDTPHRLTGDVDGDGRADVVTLARTGAVTVRFGDGRVLRGTVRTPAELVGIADVGGPDRAIVAAEHPSDADVDALELPSRAQDTARVAAVLQVGDDGLLDDTAFDPEYAVTARTPTSWFWVADHALLSTAWEGRRPARFAVAAQRLTLRGDRLVPEDVGELCWDTTAEAAPSSCRPGHDYRIDVGVRGPLPRLYPEQEKFVAAGHTMTGRIGGRTVEATLSRPDRAGHSVLEVRVDGTTYRATTPTESPDGALYPRLVPDRSDPAGFGVALHFECCDYAHVHLYAVRDGQLRLVPVPARATFGDGFADHGDRYFHTWQGPTGALFTSDGLGHGAREHVLADALVGGRFEQRSLGWVCRDPVAPDRWGRCPK